MRTRHLLLVGSILFLVVTLSAFGDSRQRTGTTQANPIVVESQIRDVSIDGDVVTIHIYRQPYEFVAPKWLRVRTGNDRTMYAADLVARDNVHIEGDLDPSTRVIGDVDHQGTVWIDRVILRGREDHRP